MHPEILSEDQKNLLPLIGQFSKNFGLIGGTAVALHLGHRRSIDFDLITFSDLETNVVRETLVKKYPIDKILVDQTNEYTVIVKGVKLTFLKYPIKFAIDIEFEKIIRIPSLITLGAIKAQVLGRRAKWKDYVDLYFITQKHSFSQLIERAEDIFGNEFNEKLFREQLVYFKDIDYTEGVDYVPGFQISDEEIKKRLIGFSLQKS